MPSFDIVSEVNQVEGRNAVDQCNKEITNRFDFKGSDARVEIQDQDKEKVLMVFADDNFKLGAGGDRSRFHRPHRRIFREYRVYRDGKIPEPR